MCVCTTPSITRIYIYIFILFLNPHVCCPFLKDGSTVLHAAALFNSPQMAQLLISRGSDVNQRDHVSACAKDERVRWRVRGREKRERWNVTHTHTHTHTERERERERMCVFVCACLNRLLHLHNLYFECFLVSV